LTAALAAVSEALEANKQIPDELYFAPRNLGIEAEIEAKLGRKKQAEDLYRKSADLIDGMLMNAPTPNIERTLISELGYIYAGNFKLASDDGDYAKAFQIIEKARGRVEAQSLANHSPFTPHDRTGAEKKLNELQLELLDTDEAQRRKRILEEIYQTEVRQIGTESIGSQSLITPVAIEKVQKQLRHDELLVEYVLENPESYVLAVTDDSVHRYSLPARDLLEAQAATYRKSVHDKKEDHDTAKRLFAELLAVVPDYKWKTAVIVIPDGKLHLLPFSSLVDGDGQYVIANHTISTAPSGTVLSLLRSRQSDEPDQRPYLGVAAWTQPELRPGFFRALLNGPSRGELESLPESKAEVESIGAMLPKPSTILLGSSATKDRFEQLPLKQYEVLHLALHGYVDPEFPDRSALVFAPLYAKSSGDAGFLQVREILKLRLNAQLVTLSACDTGVGPVGAEGIDNVVEAFIQAGAHTVVSTLWELEDQPTRHLMKVFYDHLAHGEAKADALRQAQLELLHDGASPYYWASFQVVGDPSGNLYARSKYVPHTI
jgi:CHAT domain-containing protein